mmetsp:Transcript_84/g.172  ORF Transcript_84/g.172 Transcript_84/m.172 type:complete len:85 (-) Transcript_84:355-609(-)
MYAANILRATSGLIPGSNAAVLTREKTHRQTPRRFPLLIVVLQSKTAEKVANLEGSLSFVSPSIFILASIVKPVAAQTAPGNAT